MRSPHVLGVALAALSAGCIVQPSPGYVASASAGLEVNIDRPGGDYRSFELASGRPEECRDTCMTEPQCAAFTFMNPGVQGPGARCWLKSTVPNQAPNACCISGVKSAAPPVADEAPPPAIDQAPPPIVEQAPPPVVEAPPPAQPQPPPAQPQWVGAPPPPRQPQWVGSPPPPEPPRRFERGPFEPNADRRGADYRSFDLPEPRPELCRDACLREGQCLSFTYLRPNVRGPVARCWLKAGVPRAVPDSCCISGVK